MRLEIKKTSATKARGTNIIQNKNVFTGVSLDKKVAVARRLSLAVNFFAKLFSRLKIGNEFGRNLY